MRCIPAKRKFTKDLRPVSPGESGEGLPYAPVDWPSPGDIWRWAATGKTIKQNGVYKDRFLYPPERLQRKSSNKLHFMSKISVKRYLQLEFPEADINAFLQSFSWDIPAKSDSQRKGKTAICPQSVASKKGKRKLVRGRKISKRTCQTSLIKECHGPSGVMETIDMGVEEEGTLANSATNKCTGTAGFQEGQVSDSHADGNVCGSLLECKLKSQNFTPDEFDNYLNSLDEIYITPQPVNYMSSKSEGMTVARQKLSSLLAMGFHNLASSNKLIELLALTSELQNDPKLSATELSMLKLMEEIPSASQRYLEVKEASEQADKFFADLDSKILSIASLKDEYNHAKEEKEVFQAKEASAMLAIMECNEEIGKLQTQRMEMGETIKATNKGIVQCTTIQQKVMDCLPKIVNEVQAANSQKAEWELKRKEMAEKEADILAKFATLVGFSF